MSRFALEALDAKAIVPEGETRSPRPCSLVDFDAAHLVIALKEAEHRPLIERRFPEVAHRVTYWHVDDVGLVHPSIALAMIDNHVHELISMLRIADVRKR
jgi:protein-tyrosine phosphatase